MSAGNVLPWQLWALLHRGPLLHTRNVVLVYSRAHPLRRGFAERVSAMGSEVVEAVASLTAERRGRRPPSGRTGLRSWVQRETWHSAMPRILFSSLASFGTEALGLPTSRVRRPSRSIFCGTREPVLMKRMLGFGHTVAADMASPVWTYGFVATAPCFRRSGDSWAAGLGSRVRLGTAEFFMPWVFGDEFLVSGAHNCSRPSVLPEVSIYKKYSSD